MPYVFTQGWAAAASQHPSRLWRGEREGEIDSWVSRTVSNDAGTLTDACTCARACTYHICTRDTHICTCTCTCHAHAHMCTCTRTCTRTRTVTHAHAHTVLYEIYPIHLYLRLASPSSAAPVRSASRSSLQEIATPWAWESAWGLSRAGVLSSWVLGRLSAGPVLGWTTNGRDGARCIERALGEPVRGLCAVDLTVCAQWAPRVWGLGLHSTIEGGLRRSFRARLSRLQLFRFRESCFQMQRVVKP